MNLQETTRCKEHRRVDESWRYSGLADIQATLSAGIRPSTDINQETTSHNHDLGVASRCFPEYTVRYNPSRTLSVIFWTDNALVSVIYVDRNARSYLLREKYVPRLTSLVTQARRFIRRASTFHLTCCISKDNRIEIKDHLNTFLINFVSYTM